MNWLLGVVVVLVVVVMFSGGKIEKVPAKLKSSASRFTSDHKLIMGILIGGALSWFALGNSGCIEGGSFGTEQLEKVAEMGEARVTISSSIVGDEADRAACKVVEICAEGDKDKISAMKSACVDKKLLP